MTRNEWLEAFEKSVGHLRDVLGTYSEVVQDASPDTQQPEQPALRRCEVCEKGEATEHSAQSPIYKYRCSNQDCRVHGPINDPDGAKWNAIMGALAAWKWLEQHRDHEVSGNDSQMKTTIERGEPGRSGRRGE